MNLVGRCPQNIKHFNLEEELRSRPQEWIKLMVEDEPDNALGIDFLSISHIAEIR